MPFADAEAGAHALTALGVHHFGLAPGVLHYPDVADPDAVREAGAHGLDDGLLGREAHRHEALGACGAGQLRTLGRHEQVLEKALAEALQGVADAPGLEHIHADAENHARAVCISARISRTASVSPTNSAWAMSACPMLSSTISR